MAAGMVSCQQAPRAWELPHPYFLPTLRKELSAFQRARTTVILSSTPKPRFSTRHWILLTSCTAHSRAFQKHNSGAEDSWLLVA